MAIQFILGRSGTGKTSYCVRAIADALLEESGQPLIFLVPEQASYQAERAVLAHGKVPGYSRLHVLSFDRLQFLLLGKNTTRPAISRIGRQMIVHRILRISSDKLHIFRSAAPSPGLAMRIAQTIAELHQYAETPEDIEQLVGRLRQDAQKTAAAWKFADIGLILTEYLRFIEGKFVDGDLQLTSACRAVQHADFVKGANLWVDGFASFTASELALLTELLKAVAHTQIALCLDPASVDLRSLSGGRRHDRDEPGPFEFTSRTYTALLEAINEAGLKLANPVILEERHRFSTCPALEHIERNFFSARPPSLAAGNAVRISVAANRRSEVQFVARQILQLVKERNYRFRDIAVVASDIDAYEHYIRAHFVDYDIPFFIDKRKPLNQHPLAQLVCSALQVVTGGFNHSDIFTYLKSDLVPIGRADTDAMENYCLAFGPSGEEWLRAEPWDFTAAENRSHDQARIDRIRRQAVQPLVALREGLYPGGRPDSTLTPEQFTRVLWDFLNMLDVRGRLREWIEDAVSAGDHATADEHRQFFDRLVDLLDELTEAFSGQTMSPSDYLQLLKAAFAEMTLAFIPPGLDQVLVGSIERSRHPDLKAVFLIGATQRQFPVPLTVQTVLSDDDREIAESEDFHLAPATAQVLLERQYLAYIAFTRPCELLYVTYPSMDDKGGPMARSQFVDQLQSLFEDLHEQPIATEANDLDGVHTGTELEDFLCTRLGRDVFSQQTIGTNELTQLLDEICSSETGGRLAELGPRVLSAINYRNQASLDGEAIAELLAGAIIKSSASRLSSFASCPYQHFAHYSLELKKREELKLEPLDLGNFYHRVLDSFQKRLHTEGKDIATTDDATLVSLLKEQISAVLTEHGFFSSFMRRSAHNTYILNSAAEVLEEFVPAVAEMVRAGTFRPILSEIWFGVARDSGRTLGNYEIPLSDNRLFSLDGKIDRLDMAEIDGRKVALIIDYKRTDPSFSWAEFYHGLDIQLPVYMLAVLNAADSPAEVVAGAFCVPVEPSIKMVSPRELSAEAGKFRHKAYGLFDGEYWKNLEPSACGGSRFYNLFVTKEGDPYGYYTDRATLRPDDFEQVLQFARRKIMELAEGIVSGRIQVNPYRLGDKSPCVFCDYRPVCRFDWQINDYNPLPSLKKPDVLVLIKDS